MIVEPWCVWRLWPLPLCCCWPGPCLADGGDCQSTGVGFTNGGSYLIDVTSHGNFSFASEFTGTPPSPAPAEPSQRSLLAVTATDRPA